MTRDKTTVREPLSVTDMRPKTTNADADVPKTLAQILPGYPATNKAAAAAAVTLMLRSVHWGGWSASAELSADDRTLYPVISFSVSAAKTRPHGAYHTTQQPEQRIEVRGAVEQGLFRFTAVGFDGDPIVLDGPSPQELIDIGMQLIRLRSKTRMTIASRAHRRNERLVRELSTPKHG